MNLIFLSSASSRIYSFLEQNRGASYPELILRENRGSIEEPRYSLQIQISELSQRVLNVETSLREQQDSIFSTNSLGVLSQINQRNPESYPNIQSIQEALREIGESALRYNQLDRAGLLNTSEENAPIDAEIIQQGMNFWTEQQNHRFNSELLSRRKQDLARLELLSECLKAKEIWLGHFDEDSPALMTALPLALEAHLIQSSDSFEAYKTKYPDLTISKDEYDEVRKISFDEMAGTIADTTLAEDLREDTTTSSWLKIVQRISFSRRKENERLIGMVNSAERMGEIERQKALISKIGEMSEEDLNREVELALESGSLVFLSPLIQSDSMGKLNKSALENLFEWLSIENHCELLEIFLEKKFEDLSHEQFVQVLDQVYELNNMGVYSILFKRCVDGEEDAKESFLNEFASQGVFQGVEELLSEESTFSDRSIQRAFRSALTEKNPEVIEAILDSKYLPKIPVRLLEDAFRFLSESLELDYLERMLEPEILEKIPDLFVKQCLNQAFKIAKEDKMSLEKIQFFLRNDVISLLDVDPISVFLFASRINENFDESNEREVLEVFEKFEASAFFEKIPSDAIYILIKNGIESGNTTLVLTYLASRKKDQISDRHFIEFLHVAAKSHQPDTLFQLLNHPKCPKFELGILSNLLDAAQETAHIGLIEELVSRREIEKERLPFSLCFDMLRKASARGDGELVDFLLALPEFTEVTSDDWLKNVFSFALDNNQISVAEKLYTFRPFIIELGMMLAAVKKASETGNRAVFDFFHRYSQSQLLPVLSRAELIADSSGHSELSGYLWNWIWQDRLTEERPSDAPLKRGKQNPSLPSKS